MDASEPSLNLRERKALRTQRAIIKATAELTIEDGYAAATILRIAERADVAPRTVSRWFPVKDEILFGRTAELIERARQHLERSDGDTAKRLRMWLDVEIEAAGRVETDYELERLKLRAADDDPEMRARSIQHLDKIRDLVADSIARDLGTDPAALPAQVLAGAVMEMLMGLRHIAFSDSEPSGLDHHRDQIIDELDRFFAFLGVGIEMLRRPGTA